MSFPKFKQRPKSFISPKKAETLFPRKKAETLLEQQDWSQEVMRTTILVIIIIRRRRIKEIKTAVCLSMTYPKCLSRTSKEDVFSLKTTSYQSLLFKTLVCLSLEELRRPCLLMTYPKCLSRTSKEDASMHDCAVFLWK